MQKCTIEGCKHQLHHTYKTNVFGERVRIILDKEFCKNHVTLKNAEQTAGKLQNLKDLIPYIEALEAKKNNGTIDKAELSMLNMLTKEG